MASYVHIMLLLLLLLDNVPCAELGIRAFHSSLQLGQEGPITSHHPVSINHMQ